MKGNKCNKDNFGKELRRVTVKALANKDLETFKKLLMNRAKKGETDIILEHIEHKLPYLWKTGKLIKFCDENNIIITDGGAPFVTRFVWQADE